MTERRVCSCQRALTESELFHAYGVGGTRPVEHDEPHLLAPRAAVVAVTPALTSITSAEAVRARYARQATPTDILRDLARQEHRLAIGGRS